VWAFVEINRHLEIVRACAPRKIHVIFEKPLASTGKDARADPRHRPERAEFSFMTNYQMAWWAANYTAKKQADTKALGAVYRRHGVDTAGPPPPGGRIRSSSSGSPTQTEWRRRADGLSLLQRPVWVWYMGKPTSYSRAWITCNRNVPKVETTATMRAGQRRGRGPLEGSWDLPRSFRIWKCSPHRQRKMLNGNASYARSRHLDHPLEALPAGARRITLSYMVKLAIKNQDRARRFGEGHQRHCDRDYRRREGEHQTAAP